MYQRAADSVAGAVHEFDTVLCQIRKLWTHCAPEFAAASEVIRSLRLLPHYTNMYTASSSSQWSGWEIQPCFSDSYSSGLSERLWPLAKAQWACCCTVFVSGKDGFTLCERHLGEKAGFGVYSFGALVLFELAATNV